MNQNRILVTGADGQLGSEFRSMSEYRKDLSFVFTDIDELDITDNVKVKDFFGTHPFRYIINCAGYTAVDKAEEEREKAMELNAGAVKNLALAANGQKALLVHISTDYVFDGHHHKPYTETDRENPLSWYGISKLEGERQVLMHAEKACIFRTSWLFSSYGNNFVKTIMKRAKEQEELQVVCDQIGTPTYAADLASAIMTILPRFDCNEKRLYHYSNEGVCSWYDFAMEIIGIKGIDCKIVPVTTAAFPIIARRPYYSVLSKEKIKRDFGISIPYWKDGLERCLGESKNNHNRHIRIH